MLLKLTRIWIPVALCVGGIAVIAIGGVSTHSLEVGIPVFSAGASVWLLNVLYRVGIQGDDDRHTEQDARDYFTEHGRWPDEDSARGRR